MEEVLQVKGWPIYGSVHHQDYRFYLPSKEDKLKIIKDVKCREIFHSHWRMPFRGIGYLPPPNDTKVLFESLSQVNFKQQEIFYIDFDGENKTIVSLYEKWKQIEDDLNLSDRTVFKKTNHASRIGVIPSLFWQNIPFKLGIFSLVFRSILLSIVRHSCYTDYISLSFNKIFIEFLKKKTFIKYEFANICDVSNCSNAYTYKDILCDIKDAECNLSAERLHSDLVEYCSLFENLNVDQIAIIDNFVKNWTKANLFQ